GPLPKGEGELSAAWRQIEDISRDDRQSTLFFGERKSEHPWHGNLFLIRVIHEIRGSNCWFSGSPGG
ncbi:MAG: hypothetical protein WCQ21_10095, partial [Verrucomicrobiota bacterium]